MQLSSRETCACFMLVVIELVKLKLANHVKDGCKDEDMIGLIFNTIGIRYAFVISEFWTHSFSDAITMGTDGKLFIARDAVSSKLGMRYSSVRN
jgi:hypothetical protein